MPTGTSGGRSGGGNILARLSKNELASVDDVQQYVKDVQGFMRDLTAELDFGAAKLEANLRDGNHGMDRFRATHKAKRTARALRKVRDHSHGAQVSIVRFWAVFKREWEEALAPQRKGKKTFVFNDGRK
jgi:hypothetical protein